MTDKEKICEVVEKRYEYWREKEFNSHSIESEIRMSECQHLLLMLHSLQEEPDDRWLSNRSCDDDIEYTRTDAFIEKACNGIEKLLSGYIIRNFNFGDSYDIDRLIEDFRNYMKGE